MMGLRGSEERNRGRWVVETIDGMKTMPRLMIKFSCTTNARVTVSGGRLSSYRGGGERRRNLTASQIPFFQEQTPSDWCIWTFPPDGAEPLALAGFKF